MPAMPKPPAYLGSPGRRLWREVVRRYELEPQEREMLAGACVAADHMRRLVPVALRSPAAGREYREWQRAQHHAFAAMRLPMEVAESTRRTQGRPTVPASLKSVGV